MRTVFLALVYGLILSFSALAAPFDNIITHNAAVPEQSFQLAKLWFLPDYQASSSSRSETAPAGSGDRTVECKNYTPTCIFPKEVGGKKVRVGNIFCSVECVCPSAYQYTSDNCSGAQKPSGDSCDEKYNQCLDKTCADYNKDYLSSRKTNYFCPQVDEKDVGGLNCYSCSQTCEQKYKSLGYKTGATCAEGQTTTSGTDGCSSWILCTGTACPTKFDECEFGCKTKYQSQKCYGNQEYCKECDSCKSCSEYTLDKCPENATCETCIKTCDSAKPTKYKFTKCNTGYTDDGNGGCRIACTPTCASGWSLTAPTNCKYGGSVTTADASGCGSSCYRCEAMPATSCQQVIDHTTSKFPGKIVLEGNYDCGEKTITLAEGQSLVGKSYYTGANESATNKAAGLIFTPKKSSISITAKYDNVTFANFKVKHTSSVTNQRIIDLGKDRKNVVIKDMYFLFDSQNMPQFAGSSFDHTTAIYGTGGGTMELKGNVYIENIDNNPSNPTSRYNKAIRFGENYGSPYGEIQIKDSTVVNINLTGNFTDAAFVLSKLMLSGNARVYTKVNGWSASSPIEMRGNSYYEAQADLDDTGNGAIGNVQMFDQAKLKVASFGTCMGGLYGYGFGQGPIMMNSADNVITYDLINGATRGYAFFFTKMGCKAGSKMVIKGTTYNCVRDLTTATGGEKGDIPPSPWFTKPGYSQSCQPYFTVTGSCPAHGSCTICPINSSYIRIDKCDDGWTVSGSTCKQTCLYNRTYQPDFYSCTSCTRLGVTYYGGTCYKNCEDEFNQKQMKCYQDMDSCMNSGKTQDVCYQQMEACMMSLQNEIQNCIETIEETAIKNW